MLLHHRCDDGRAGPAGPVPGVLARFDRGPRAWRLDAADGDPDPDRGVDATYLDSGDAGTGLWVIGCTRTRSFCVTVRWRAFVLATTAALLFLLAISACAPRSRP